MISNKLEKNVRNQLGFKAWNDKELHDTLKDVRNHGADGGFSGFIYCKDTCKFARDNMEEILESIKEDASGMGEDPLIFVQNFNCFGTTNTISTLEIASIIYDKPDLATLNDGMDKQVLNALAWYALEETARFYELEEAEQV
tara:strand:+ start:664 stop:1089 length:426 start_codon:yes stop_codon:yes gene_type:complete